MTLDRSKIPNTKNLPSLALPYPKKEKINESLDLSIYESKDHDLITIDIVWQSGAWYSSDFSIPYMVNKMIPRGTKTKDAIEIADTLEKHGAHLHIETGQDYTHFQFKILPRYLHATLPLFMEIVNDADFPIEGLPVIKKLVKSEVTQKHASTAFLAEKTLRKNIFGTQHPYGYTLTEADVEKVTKQSLKTHYKKYQWHFPQVVVTGNITMQDLLLIKESLAPIKPKGNFQVPTHKIIPFQKQQTIHVPHSKQSSIALGNTTILQAHYDYHDLLITNTLLGGFFGSRLIKNLREQKGYTYGIYSYLVPWVKSTYWCISADVNKDITKEAISEIKKEILFLQSKTPTDSEVNVLKNYLLGKLVANVDNIFSVSKHYWMTSMHQLDLSYYHHLYERIQTITPQRIQEVANLYFDIDKMFEVVVTS